MVYLIRWLDNTFKSRKITEELLLPDLQDGVITSHDYELAADFLPGWHRWYGEITAICLGTPFAYYGHYHTHLYRLRSPTHPLALRPRWPLSRTFALTVGAYISGKIIGQVSRLRAHIKFTQSLDDPEAFSRAMENVNARMGGKMALGFSIASLGGQDGQRNEAGVVGGVMGMTGAEELARRRKSREEEDLGGFSAAPVTEIRGDGWTTDDVPEKRQTPAPNDSPIPPSSTSKSKWDEIRAANSRGANSSSWDAVRQSHERARVNKADSSSSSSADADDFSSDLSDSKSQEQARFDAILDAERNIKPRE